VWEDRPNAQLVLIGDGNYRSKLQKIVQKMGLQNRVTFTGFVNKNDLFSWYKATDVFVFASTTETQGLVLLEAMSVGTPVVAVNEMGARDIISDHRGGFASHLDIPEFTSHVKKLLSDDSLRQKKNLWKLLKKLKLTQPP